ncbi:hypothetical protein [Barnesiella intestinihominis]|uniref:hypothetical protein n=1 Tax=Barnesiella intestinihominis TaxID=487174 RepID=UPI0039677184
MAILDDLLNRWKEKTPEEKIDLTQPAPPVVSPVSKIINSDWQNTASGGKRTDGTPLVDGKNLQQSWENTVAANRSKLPVPYIDATTGYGVSADGTSEKPVFHVTPEQAAQMREAAEAGESFVSIYNRILKRPEEIDPRIVENRRKLAVLGDVGATLAEIIGVAAGGNAAARKPATAVNNAFLQNLLDRRDQMQMLYDQGLLKAAFQDKVGRDAAQAAEAQREYETQMAIWNRRNQIQDKQEQMAFDTAIKQIEIKYKDNKDRLDRELKKWLAEYNRNTKYGVTSMKNKGSDLYKKGSDIPLSGGKRIKISESELPFSAGSLFQAARQAVIDAGLGDEKMKNEYGEDTTVTEQLLRIDDMLRNNPNSAKTAIQEIGSLMRKYPQIEQKVLEAAENIGLYIEGIEQLNAQDDDFSQNIID